MIKSVVLAFVTAAAAIGSTSAHAGGVSWSVGVNAPGVSTVVTNGPGYYRPGYRHGYGRVYAPAPVYVPTPVYRVPPRVAYYPPPVVYRPAPVVYPRYYPGWRHDRRHWDGHRDYHGRR